MSNLCTTHGMWLEGVGCPRCLQLEVEQLKDFLFRHCVGVNPSAEAARWELIGRNRESSDLSDAAIIARLRQLPAPPLPSIKELLEDVHADEPLYKCDRCGTPMHCGSKQWEYQCNCRGPAALVGALQDVVHTDPGPVRAAKAVRAHEPGGDLAACECLVRNKAPSAYHNPKCPRYVEGKYE